VATRTIVEMTDDLDGSEADETILFGLDGMTYEIDLNKAHAEGLRDALTRYIEAGRRAGRASGDGRAAPRNGNGRKPARMDPAQRKAIRSWANDNGFTISQTGRIPREALEAWEKAHAG
jgi:hypothetical protein